MGDRFNLLKESCYLEYLDANNLYGKAMIQDLSQLVGSNGWRTQMRLRVIMLSEESGKGCLLKVDMSYPDNSHDLHNDLPFM